MGSPMSVMLAFTLEHAAFVTGATVGRIRYWDRTGVLSPSLGSGRERSAYGRIYSFRDVVGLRTLVELRDRFRLPLQRLRLIGEHLRRHYETPWSSLRFYVNGRDLFFRAPGSDVMVSALPAGQVAMEFVLELEAVASRTEAAAEPLRRRKQSDIGEIVQNRYVLGNRPVLAGTRIPTKAVWDYHRAGYGTGRIIELYPKLTPIDVERAIEYERDRVAKRARRAG